eukprot:CAMPEP_0170239426 /NCGR_PEP_ID=MMETSP0116_2-20130129/19470_1 /TAXON_ID=400756 /ORGANISM="Durinskia baltica, Strain CSIRO CS-38" /LENGTH=79 /DNA_ID=CAMNT_0010490243 /DNA_START=98 /DNA_END=333 /DNA_ORIENTATION=-
MAATAAIAGFDGKRAGLERARPHAVAGRGRGRGESAFSRAREPRALAPAIDRRVVDEVPNQDADAAVLALVDLRALDDL